MCQHLVSLGTEMPGKERVPEALTVPAGIFIYFLSLHHQTSSSSPSLLPLPLSSGKGRIIVHTLGLRDQSW